MSWKTIHQLYADADTVAKKVPMELVTELTAKLFNANLAELKAKHPEHQVLQAIPEAKKGIRYKDLLAMAGALRAALEETEGGPAVMAAGGRIMSDPGEQPDVLRQRAMWRALAPARDLTPVPAPPPAPVAASAP